MKRLWVRLAVLKVLLGVRERVLVVTVVMWVPLVIEERVRCSDRVHPPRSRGGGDRLRERVPPREATRVSEVERTGLDVRPDPLPGLPRQLNLVRRLSAHQGTDPVQLGLQPHPSRRGALDKEVVERHARCGVGRDGGSGGGGGRASVLVRQNCSRLLGWPGE